VLASGVRAQDTVYLIDGQKRICHVESITPDQVTVTENREEKSFSRSEVLLIEYKNGRTEIYNLPTENLSVNPDNGNITAIKKPEKHGFNSYFSVNTLALCNADISAFYEYMPKGKSFSFGVMGAYNFNLYSTAQNLFISALNNGKKNYDLGATISVFPFEQDEELSIYIGAMIKYTDLSFNLTTTDTINNARTVKYTPAKGYQLATMFTVGTQTFINDHFYIRSLVGLGAFGLHGDYKTEFNHELNSGSKSSQQSNFNFLPKIYLGVNIGFNF
jgi:hypothetical protein